MAQAIITLIPNYMQVVVDNSAGTATLQTYDSSNSTWNTQVSFNVSNGQITLNQILNIAQTIASTNSPMNLDGNVSITGELSTNTLNANVNNDSGGNTGGDMVLALWGGIQDFPTGTTSTMLGMGIATNGTVEAYTSSNWNIWQLNYDITKPAFSVGGGDAGQAGSQFYVASANNTLDDGSGNMAANPATTSLAGTTAGTIDWAQPERGTRKVFIAVANGYENDTTTDQTITFPVAFANTPAVSVNTTGLTVTVTTTELSITAPDSTTTYSGVIEVIGI